MTSLPESTGKKLGLDLSNQERPQLIELTPPGGGPARGNWIARAGPFPTRNIRPPISSGVSPYAPAPRPSPGTSPIS